MQPSSLSKASGSTTAQVNMPISELIRDFNSLINSTVEIETNTHPEQSSLPITQNKPEQRLPSDKALEQLKIKSKKGAVTTGQFDSLFSGKSEEIKKQEIEAVIKFKAALSQDIPIQKELSELSIQQLNVLLPYTYLEASHSLNPVIAYNTPDRCYRRESILDDNVAMLQAYGVFLSDINKLLPSEVDEENKIEVLKESMKKVFSILLYGDSSRSTYINEEYRTRFSTLTNLIYEGGKTYDSLLKLSENSTSNKIQYNIKDLDTDIFISLDRPGHITFLCNNPERNKESILYNLSKALLLAYKEKNLLHIFKLTSDFMYCHILYNANGRASQILRDCFALMLNQAPMPALTPFSHYIYLSSKVDEKHLMFMQALFHKRLHSIKHFNVDKLTGANQINNLIKKFNRNEAILTDVIFYKHLFSESISFNSTHQERKRNILCCALQ